TTMNNGMVDDSIKKRKPGRKAAESERWEFPVHLDPNCSKIPSPSSEAQFPTSIELEVTFSEWLDRGKHRVKTDEATSGSEKRRVAISMRVFRNIRLPAMDRRVTASSHTATAITGWVALNKSRAQSFGREH